MLDNKIKSSPFGSSLPGRAWSDVNRGYRYGFNGKEKDSETANDAYDFGARIYDGRLGRWLSLDPLLLQHPDVSAYRMALNNPLFFVDIGGFTEYSFYTRHFIPEKLVTIISNNLYFKGDGRGFSPWLNQSARIHNKITLETTTGEYVAKKTDTWCSPTYMFTKIANTWFTAEAIADPYEGTLREPVVSDKSITVGQNYNASDPLGTSLAPDIDFDVSISIKENKEEKTIEFSTLLIGDQYPAAEQFVVDPNGKKLILGVSPATGSIIDSYGKGTKTLISSYTKVNVDSKGNFLSVVNLDGTSVSIDDYNKQFTSKPTSK